MQVAEVMTRQLDQVSPDTSLQEMARMMRDDDIGVLPVTAEGRLVGIVTDRDMVTRGIADGHGPSEARARDVMSQRVLYCSPEHPLETVLASMAKAQIRRVPVLDAEKKLIGILSLGDCARVSDAALTGQALKAISCAEIAGQPAAS